MKAQPGPIVSGSHFLPKAPLLCVKWMPVCVVMSLKWICAELADTKNTNHRDTETQRNLDRNLFWFSLWLCDSVVNRSLGKDIYLEAPAEIAVEASRALPGRTAEAAVPIWIFPSAGSGTDTCS